jgi:hypothetical protein
MTDQPAFAYRRMPSLRRSTTICLCLTIAIALSGCAALKLSTFKKHAAANDFEWIAGQMVTCDKASDVCGQLHLIKGDACFRLAKKGVHALEDYTCASDELEKGLALNRTWKDADVHRQYGENLCESLRNLQDHQSGQAATKTLNRFVAAAEGLYQQAPESVPAVFYLAKAHLRQVEPMLIDINSATRVPVCNRLKRAVTSVLSITEKAKHTALPEWDRYAGNYQELSFELGATMRAAQCP